MSTTLAILLLVVAVVNARLPLLGENVASRIPYHYIVIYQQNVTMDQVMLHTRSFSERVYIKHTYEIGDTFKGFSAKIVDKTALEALLDDPLIAAVHCDDVATIVDNSCGATQSNSPSWGIARVSHKGVVTNGLNDDFYYSPTATGDGVTAYVLDTGIYIAHQNFQGRASYGANFVDNVDTDQNSHGTHCAGTIGGATFGIAKNVNLVAVKVLGAGGSGTLAGVIRGIEWVTSEHRRLGGPSVASMSLGATSDGGMNAAVGASTAAGVVYSIAAGNSNADACYFYPASAPEAITVGSTAITSSGEIEFDDRSSFSNYGTCVDIFAPGSLITSAAITSPTSSSVKSGTSMACPHVTGVIATLLELEPNADAATIHLRLESLGQKNILRNPGTGSPNLLLYNGCDEA